MSEELDRTLSMTAANDDLIQSAPPPTKQIRRRRARATRVAVGESEILSELRKQNDEFRRRLEAIEIGSPAAQGGPTLAEVQAAKAILSQAEAAMGISQPKVVAPMPLHPKKIEDPLQGDKTPAVVEWYKANAPEEYDRRYAGRKTHLEDRRGERRVPVLPAGVTPAPFPDDPDGIVLSKTDDSGRSPRLTSQL